jgi:23S rRNA (adenine2503-C2)-methyltransferase
MSERFPMVGSPDVGSPLVDLKALTREQLTAWVVGTLGDKRYRADQVFRWLHARGARDFGAMTDLSKALRLRLLAASRIGGLALEDVRVAADGTRKLLLRTGGGHRIESVVIPMADRITLCVSSQVGCKVGCAFCLTGRMTTRTNLAASEIVDQVYHAQSVLTGDERISNIVYMGMGEPLDNYDHVVASLRILIDELGQNFSGRRITVSTSGLVPKIARLGQDVPVNLAVSLNATTDALRDVLIPINRKWPIAQLLEALHAFPLAARRRITVEYVLLDGVNDRVEDARRLVRLLRGLRCKVNLIPFNPFPGAPYGRPAPDAVDAFGAIVRDADYTVTIRYSKGDDIGAACGQLDGAAAA